MNNIIDKRKENIDSLSVLFDLLARFDYEDKKKEESMLKTGPLASAPKGSVFSMDYK